jgi:3-oxoacyl-[acyl-carrier-protein] synthase II
MPDRVVVTGLGCVSAAGWGVDAFRRALRSATTSIGMFDRFDHAKQRTHVAGQVPGDAPNRDRFVRWSRLSNSDRFALFSANEAIEAAGLAAPLGDAAVFIGGSTGGLLEAEKYFESMRGGDEPSMHLLASHGLSAPAETIARHLGVTGPVETISSACASGGLAIEQALRSLRNGEADIAIAGGADCLSITTYSGFNALRAVDERACRPFRADREGMSLGEGGAALVLETLEHATARGARILAEVAGGGASCDAHHMTAPRSEGTGAAAAMAHAIADARLQPDAIDFINAHGTGTPLNDSAEFAAYAQVFGDAASRIPIEATKAVIGHLLGAAGAIEAVATVLALIDGELHPAPGDERCDSAAPVNLVAGASRAFADVRSGLSANFGFGGANAAVVFGRWPSS